MQFTLLPVLCLFVIPFEDYIAKHKYFDSQMTFEELNVEELLSHGKHLLASAGYEYAAYSVGGTKLTAEEQTAFYRRQLNERLGIASAGKIFSTGNAMSNLIRCTETVKHVFVAELV